MQNLGTGTVFLLTKASHRHACTLSVQNTGLTGVISSNLAAVCASIYPGAPAWGSRGRGQALKPGKNQGGPCPVVQWWVIYFNVVNSSQYLLGRCELANGKITGTRDTYLFIPFSV